MVAKGETGRPPSSSHLFMLRLWPEDMGGGRTDWRGRVQHVSSGEARYFRDWATLESFVERLLRGAEPEATPSPNAEHDGTAPRE